MASHLSKMKICYYFGRTKNPPQNPTNKQQQQKPKQKTPNPKLRSLYSSLNSFISKAIAFFPLFLYSCWNKLLFWLHNNWSFFPLVWIREHTGNGVLNIVVPTTFTQLFLLEDFVQTVPTEIIWPIIKRQIFC